VQSIKTIFLYQIVMQMCLADKIGKGVEKLREQM
jgi:hypothetical protein